MKHLYTWYNPKTWFSHCRYIFQKYCPVFNPWMRNWWFFAALKYIKIGSCLGTISIGFCPNISITKQLQWILQYVQWRQNYSLPSVRPTMSSSVRSAGLQYYIYSTLLVLYPWSVHVKHVFKLPNKHKQSVSPNISSLTLCTTRTTN